MTENFPNLVKKITYKSRKHRVPNKMNLKRSTPRHNIIEFSKVNDKDCILKAAREKQLVTHKGAPMRLSAAAFSTETLQGLKGMAQTMQGG